MNDQFIEAITLQMQPEGRAQHTAATHSVMDNLTRKEENVHEKRAMG